MAAIFARARSNIAHIVEREMAGERITAEVWNLRFCPSGCCPAIPPTAAGGRGKEGTDGV